MHSSNYRKKLIAIMFLPYIMGDITTAPVVVNTVTWTMYNVTYENDFIQGSDTRLTSCDGTTTFEVVGIDFAKAIRLQGSGFLSDGRFIKLGDCCTPCDGDDCLFNCFEEDDTGPTGKRGNPLTPFVSVASNDIDYGTIIKVASLEGVQLLSGEVRNGCVRVDDTCDICDRPNWINWYVLSHDNVIWFAGNGMLDSTSVEYPSDCDIKSYRGSL